MAVRCDVAILGAGPYGLSVAAHLRSMHIETLIFGGPMEFWQSRMPSGMLLRSERHASNISDPNDCLRLDDYLASAGVSDSERVRVEDFIEYGRWFQKQGVGHLDRRKIASLVARGSSFSLTLDDGDQLEAMRVVIA